MSHVTRITAAALCSVLLTACGQSGPLTLPNQGSAPAASQNGEAIPEIIPEAGPEAMPDPPADPDDKSA